jgi:hypothetical protein
MQFQARTKEVALFTYLSIKGDSQIRVYFAIPLFSLMFCNISPLQYKLLNINSIQFLFISMLTQQLKGQLQSEHE